MFFPSPHESFFILSLFYFFSLSPLPIFSSSLFCSVTMAPFFSLFHFFCVAPPVLLTFCCYLFLFLFRHKILEYPHFFQYSFFPSVFSSHLSFGCCPASYFLLSSIHIPSCRDPLSFLFINCVTFFLFIWVSVAFGTREVF